MQAIDGDTTTAPMYPQRERITSGVDTTPAVNWQVQLARRVGQAAVPTGRKPPLTPATAPQSAAAASSADAAPEQRRRNATECPIMDGLDQPDHRHSRYTEWRFPLTSRSRRVTAATLSALAVGLGVHASSARRQSLPGGAADPCGLPGGARDIRGDDVGSVPVQAAAGPLWRTARYHNCPNARPGAGVQPPRALSLLVAL